MKRDNDDTIQMNLRICLQNDEVGSHKKEKEKSCTNKTKYLGDLGVPLQTTNNDNWTTDSFPTNEEDKPSSPYKGMELI